MFSVIFETLVLLAQKYKSEFYGYWEMFSYEGSILAQKTSNQAVRHIKILVNFKLAF